MKRIYVVFGTLEDCLEPDIIYGAYPTMERADEICSKLGDHPDNIHSWYLREVVLEEE